MRKKAETSGPFSPITDRMNSVHRRIEFQISRPEVLDQAACALFRHALSLDDVMRIFAVPEGSKVWMGGSAKRFQFSIRVPCVLEYSFFRDSSNRLVAHLDAWEQGYGGRVDVMSMLATHVKEFRKLGVDVIELSAVEPSSSFNPEANGAKVWPRMGFDAPLSANLRSKLPLSLSHATRVSDLMQLPEGVAFWDAHCELVDLTFDLAPDSLSSRFLEAWEQARKEDPKTRLRDVWQRFGARFP